ncbi:hypothetical protein Hamer_G016868 [Homarus americanus]|uniref:Uncharacterized protein n=1 Tax=Homarus americanus TaxID=6706 RepID=A0A8J5K629_HOMAM|nr:hypothetical protein Hamer_G016868 [Homarus americanus]
MPTGFSPVAELLMEASRRRLDRMQAGNDGLHQVNADLLEQIQDLRQHIQMRQEVLQQRRSRRLGLRGGVYRIVDPPAGDS